MSEDQAQLALEAFKQAFDDAENRGGTQERAREPDPHQEALLGDLLSEAEHLISRARSAGEPLSELNARLVSVYAAPVVEQMRVLLAHERLVPPDYAAELSRQAQALSVLAEPFPATVRDRVDAARQSVNRLMAAIEASQADRRRLTESIEASLPGNRATEKACRSLVKQRAEGWLAGIAHAASTLEARGEDAVELRTELARTLEELEAIATRAERTPDAIGDLTVQFANVYERFTSQKRALHKVLEEGLWPADLEAYRHPWPHATFLTQREQAKLDKRRQRGFASLEAAYRKQRESEPSPPDERPILKRMSALWDAGEGATLRQEAALALFERTYALAKRAEAIETHASELAARCEQALLRLLSDEGGDPAHQAEIDQSVHAMTGLAEQLERLLARATEDTRATVRLWQLGPTDSSDLARQAYAAQQKASDMKASIEQRLQAMRSENPMLPGHLDTVLAAQDVAAKRSTLDQEALVAACVASGERTATRIERIAAALDGQMRLSAGQLDSYTQDLMNVEEGAREPTLLDQVETGLADLASDLERIQREAEVQLLRAQRDLDSFPPIVRAADVFTATWERVEDLRNAFEEFLGRRDGPEKSLVQLESKRQRLLDQLHDLSERDLRDVIEEKLRPMLTDLTRMRGALDSTPLLDTQGLQALWRQLETGSEKIERLTELARTHERISPSLDAFLEAWHQRKTHLVLAVHELPLRIEKLQSSLADAARDSGGIEALAATEPASEPEKTLQRLCRQWLEVSRRLDGLTLTDPAAADAVLARVIDLSEDAEAHLEA